MIHLSSSVLEIRRCGDVEINPLGDFGKGVGIPLIPWVPLYFDHHLIHQTQYRTDIGTDCVRDSDDFRVGTALEASGHVLFPFVPLPLYHHSVFLALVTAVALSVASHPFGPRRLLSSSLERFCHETLNSGSQQLRWFL